MNAYHPIPLPQLRPLVNDCSVDGLNASELTAKAEDEQHEEEQHCPELREGHLKDGFRVSHES